MWFRESCVVGDERCELETFSITFHIVYGIISCASFIQSALYSLIYVAAGRIVSCLLKEGRERTLVSPAGSVPAIGHPRLLPGSGDSSYIGPRSGNCVQCRCPVSVSAPYRFALSDSLSLSAKSRIKYDPPASLRFPTTESTLASP